MTMKGMRAILAHESLQSYESQAGIIEIGKDMEKLALLKIARCRAPAWSSPSWRRNSMVSSGPPCFLPASSPNPVS